MSTTLLPLVFAGGMDQNNNTIVGPPGIQKLERARFVAPGQVMISPGYYWDSQIATPGMREIFQVGGLNVLVVASSGKFSIVTRDNPAHTVTRAPGMLAVEAPSRVTWNPVQSTYQTSPQVGQKVRVFAAAVSGTLWILFATWDVSGAGGYRTQWALYDGLQQMTCGAMETSPGTPYDNVGVALNQDTSATVVWARAGVYFYVLQWVANSSAWIQLQALAVGPGALWIVDSHTQSYGTSGTSTLSLLGSTQYAWNWIVSTGAALSNFDVTPTGGGAGSTAIALTGYSGADGTTATLVRVGNTGWCRAYAISSGAALTAEFHALAGYIPSRITVSNQVKYISSGTFEFLIAADWTDTLGTPTVIVALVRCNGSALTLPLGVVTRIPHSTLVGRPYRVNSEWFVPVMNDGQVSRCYRLQVASNGPSGFDGDVPTHNRSFAIGAIGEMPLPAQIDQGKASAFTLAQFPPVEVTTVRDSLTGAFKPVRIFPFSAVSSGVLSTANCVLNASALLVALDNGTSFAGLRPTPFDGNASIVPSGQPWLEGSDSIAAGFQYDAPIPVVTQGGAGAVFTSGAIYQYALVAEFRDVSGNLYRSPPSQPVSVTPTVSVASISVAISAWPYEFPRSPGVIRVYRTIANGTVFYATGATNTFAFDAAITDTVTDAALVGGQLLYTQAQNAFGGLKAKYGIPPHRFGARGKERMIVGGVEKPNRVRWSLTLFPGEGIAFPHPSETGWFQDFPCPELTAAWFLDDAWIVASRDQIWEVQGPGPDDNGQGGSFDPPQLIESCRGIITSKSLCEIPEGLLYQSTDSQIYLIARGGHQVQWFSGAVKDELNRGLVNGAVANPIIASTYNEAAQTVHFWRMPGDTIDSSPIVYDIRYHAWSLDGETNSAGLNGCYSAGAIRMSNPAGQSVPTVAAVNFATLTIEKTDQLAAPLTQSGGAWQAQLTTNDFAPFGFGGWGRVQTIGAIVDVVSGTASLGLSIWRNRRQGTADETGTLAESTSGTTEEYPQLTHALNLSKMSHMRVQITWTGRLAKPSGLIMQIEAAQRAERTGSSKRT